jgi:hypothetical protein
LRLAMTHSYRTFVRSEVSTKPGQVQSSADTTMRPVCRAYVREILRARCGGLGRRSRFPVAISREGQNGHG